jgi:hypothetical protein
MFEPGRLAAAVALGGLLTPALAAQSLADLCRAASAAKVGQWASFDVKGGASEGGKLRLAIVGSERQGDSTFYWVELAGTSATDPARNGIMQSLVADLGAHATPVRAMIAKVGNQPAIKVPQAMLAMTSQTAAQHNTALAFAHRCDGAQIVGSETVTVPAGSFATVHVKSEGGDAWVSKAVPFTIVKVSGHDGSTMLLVGYGTDAKSSITETPQEMTLPGMLPKP